MELFATLPDLLGGALTLAKEIGKGGGGSEEEPTVCMTLLPFALGLIFAAVQSARRRLAAVRARA
jgi:hypothetical protein